MKNIFFVMENFDFEKKSMTFFWSKKIIFRKIIFSEKFEIFQEKIMKKTKNFTSKNELFSMKKCIFWSKNFGFFHDFFLKIFDFFLRKLFSGKLFFCSKKKVIDKFSKSNFSMTKKYFSSNFFVTSKAWRQLSNATN